jgi:[ribosomal protein S5]-alanine N-acetyltransferase
MNRRALGSLLLRPTPDNNLRVLEEIRTNRLLLRRPSPADLDDLLVMHQDPRVMATLGGVRTPEQIKSFFTRWMDDWDRNGFSWWSIRMLDTGKFAGRGGLRRVPVEGRDEVEVGYGFLSEFWGRGLATELARESVRLGFEELRLPNLVSFTLPTNLASRRVMEKAGFRYERDIIHANLPHVLYRQFAYR